MNETDAWKRFVETSHNPQTLPFDHTLCRDASLRDIDVQTVTNLFQRERVQKQEWFRASMTSEELLEHLSLLQKGGLTYGAVLCFGKKPSKWVAEAFTRCISYKGDDRLGGWEEDQEFRGSLLEQYESGISFLQKNLRLNRVISVEGSVEQWEMPLVALREAVANALVHREYADQRNCVRIELFDSRIEISSPGGLPGSLTIEELGLGEQYPLRNPHIAHVFYLYNYTEKLGTGIARMQRAMQEARLPQPQFDTNGGRTFKVVLSRVQRVDPHTDEATKIALVLNDLWKRYEALNRGKLHILAFDKTLCRDASLADINMEAVTGFSQKERVQRELGRYSDMTNQELLAHLNLLQEGGKVLTYGAILCFGKNPTRWVAGAFTRCTLWMGNDRLEDSEEDQEFSGNLLEQYELSIAFLQENLCLSRVMSAEGSVEQWEIPMVVLREAVANAFIHREYADQTDNVRVEVFEDRVEISSPGKLSDGLTIEHLGKETDYPIRNPQIARIFYLCNYVERFGTGTARMQRTMKKAGLPEPQFDTNGGRTFKVILRRPQRAAHYLLAETSLSSDAEAFDTLKEPPFSSDSEESDTLGELPISAKSVDRYAKTTLPSPSRGRGFVSNRRVQLISLVLIILLLAVSSFFTFYRRFSSTPLGLGIISEPNNEQIGLSDGTYAFDTGTDRADASLKKQGAAKLAQGDKAGAMSQWDQAVRIDTNDAEALIYLEDQRVLASGSPYITLVVATTLTGSPNDINSGRDDLQGAYVAQKEYNDGLKLGGGRQIRLLIANAGSKKDYVPEVAGQIVQAAKQDTTIVGVMGWHSSSYAQIAIPILTRAHIPMVSSTASADSLSGMSSYFFRVAPPNKSQAIAGAHYAEQQLHASRVALFVDPKDAYSSNLADDFEQQFVTDGNQIVDRENYTVGDKSNLSALLQNALKSNPDLIYFAGYADDLSVLLVNLGMSHPDLQILGGDGLYTPNAYSSTARSGLSRVRFTALAYPDEWSILGLDDPLFFSEYSTNFNPRGANHNGSPYGFTRANDGTILAYDATHALLQGCQNVLVAKGTLTSTVLQYGLTQISGADAIQGVSGQISFDSNGNPTDKAIVILYFNSAGDIQMLLPNGMLGCFVVGTCR